MKRLFFSFLFFLTLVLFVSAVSSSVFMPVLAESNIIPLQSSSVLPPIIPPNTNYTVIDETVDITQDVEIQSNATLHLENARIIVRKRRAEIVFNGSRLYAVDSRLEPRRSEDFSISFYGSSSVYADDLRIDEEGSLYVYDSSDLTLLRSYVGGPLTVYNFSTVRMSEGEVQNVVVVQDFSTVSVSGGNVEESQWTVEDNAIVSISNAVAMISLVAEDSSVVTVSNTIVLTKLHAFDSSIVSLSGVTVSGTRGESGLSCFHSSRVTMSESRVDWLRVFDSSIVSLFKTLLKTSGVRCYDSSIVYMFDVRMIGITYIIHDFSSVTILNSLASTDTLGRGTRIEASDSSKVWMLSPSSVLGSLNARGSSEVRVMDAEDVWMLNAYDSAFMSVRSSNVTLFRTHDSSVASLEDSFVSSLGAYDSSSVSIVRSIIDEVSIRAKSVTCSVEGAKTGSLKNFWVSPVDIGPDGYIPEITFEETEIQGGWRLFLSGSSSVTITDSFLEYLSLSDSSVVWLIGSDATTLNTSSEAKAYFHWYLDVYVPSGADVRVKHPDGTVDHRWNVTDRFARFILIEKMMNASGTYRLVSDPYNVTVIALGAGYSGQQSVEIFGNESVFLLPPTPFWQEYWYVILGLVVVGVIVAFVLSRRARAHT